MAPPPHTHHRGHDHRHAHAHGSSGRMLGWALLLTFAFAGVELTAGLWARSLALTGDAGHMFSDAVALGLAAVADWFARRPPSTRHSYGLARAEVLAAAANGLVMLGVVIAITIEAIERLRAPAPVAVAGGVVAMVAFLGLLVNAAVAFVLGRGEENLNVRAARLHVFGDVLGSVAALIAGAVIYVTGWTPIDPILSLFICVLIIYSTLKLLREALHVLMEGVPLHLDLNSVGMSLAQVGGVASVHDLHIWTLSSGVPALSAHVVLRDMAHWPRVLEQMRQLLAQHYRIEHVTLQPEITTEHGATSATISISSRSTKRH